MAAPSIKATSAHLLRKQRLIVIGALLLLGVVAGAVLLMRSNRPAAEYNFPVYISERPIPGYKLAESVSTVGIGGSASLDASPQPPTNNRDGLQQRYTRPGSVNDPAQPLDEIVVDQTGRQTDYAAEADCAAYSAKPCTTIGQAEACTVYRITANGYTKAYCDMRGTTAVIITLPSGPAETTYDTALLEMIQAMRPVTSDERSSIRL